MFRQIGFKDKNRTELIQIVCERNNRWTLLY